MTVSSRRRAVIIATALGLVAALMVAGAVTSLEAPSGPEQRVQHLSRQLWCPVCPGQTVAESNSATARAMEQTVRERVEAGDSDEEILQYFVSQYGADILTRPPLAGFATTAWVGAVVGLMVGGLSFVLFLRQGAGRRHGGDAPRAQHAAGLAAEDEARVERALRRYL